ncbi:DUF362 domain-containing protein [Planctomycetota bacterium]
MTNGEVGEGVGRRAFVRMGLAAGAGALLQPGSGRAAGDKTRVVAASSKKVFKDERTLDQRVVQELVDGAVARLMGESDATAAWKRVAKPSDVVGIKVNCLAGTKLSTRIEVVRAIADGLRRAGVPAKSILVWDRKTGDLERAKYPLDDRSQFRCVGCDTAGFHGQLILKGEIGSLFTKLVTHHCSVIINVPVFKDHDLAGVSVALKSFFGAIHNPNKYHFANLHQAIVDVNRVRYIAAKTVLHICDATFGCAHGGPTPAPKWLERMGTVYATRDPVALDRTAWDKVEALRKARGLASLVGSKREPKHIALAAERLLGTNDPSKIELVKLGV